MDYLPVFLNVTGRTALVVGGGETANRKVEFLRRADLAVRVVAPDLEPGLAEAVAAGDIDYCQERFREGHLDGWGVVVAATNDRPVNAAVAEAAQARGVPVNVVDDPELSTFIVPAVVDRSPLVIALGTGGRAPVLARLMRAKLEAFIPAAYGRLAELVGRFRDSVKDRFRDGVARRRFWEDVLDGPIAERVLRGDTVGGERDLAELLESGEEPSDRCEVALVGAGPGDPDLLTVKALRVMQRADVVVHDRLVSPELLDRVRRDAERVFVGKAAGRHSHSQQEINELLVGLARQGKRVLRLKGGDPFVFARGGEELAHLREAGVPFHVVPGVTAALGCAAYAGIPLTHRDHAHAAVLVTGHLRDGVLELPWEALVQPYQTVAVYMGLKGLPQLRDGLIARGLSEATPAALVEQGTTPDQRVIEAPLAELPDRVEAQGARPPCLVLIGEVVGLRGSLQWVGSSAAGSGARTSAFEIDL